MASNQHSEHYFGGPYTWQDTKNGSRMEFASFEEMQSFLHWKSGRLEEQLEAAREEVLFLCSDEDDIRKGLREQLEASEDFHVQRMAPLLEELGRRNEQLEAALEQRDSFTYKSVDIERLQEQLESQRQLLTEAYALLRYPDGGDEFSQECRAWLLKFGSASSPATSAVPVTPEARAGSTEPGLLETAEGRAISERADALNAEGEAYQEELQRLWDADRAEHAPAKEPA